MKLRHRIAGLGALVAAAGFAFTGAPALNAQPTSDGGAVNAVYTTTSRDTAQLQAVAYRDHYRDYEHHRWWNAEHHNWVSAHRRWDRDRHTYVWDWPYDYSVTVHHSHDWYLNHYHHW